MSNKCSQHWVAINTEGKYLRICSPTGWSDNNTIEWVDISNATMFQIDSIESIKKHLKFSESIKTKLYNEIISFLRCEVTRSVRLIHSEKHLK